MVLGRAVYDIRGHLVLGERDKLTEDSLGLLARSGTAEILIEDPRVADVLVGSLFSAHLEAQAVQALHVFLVMRAGTTEGVRSGDLIGIRPHVRSMAQRLYPAILGDPDLSGLATVQGYDYVHPVKVAGLSMLLGRLAGLDQDTLVRLGMAAMLENAGYLSLPPGILEKTGPLTEDDWQHVRKHPHYSAAMVETSGIDSDVLQGIGQHHERWSGSGYPEGRKGDEISLFARIIALADIYHALLSKRPHREAFKPHEAAEFIIAYSGDWFDPQLVQIFARKIPQYPAGLGVKLSTGETGIVSNPNVGHIARPIVRICFEGDRPVREPYDLDLSEPRCMNKLIVQVLL
jgi:HD-GYP domain-containing protein (c-di-GMP phosphodiesterase class II)